MQQKSWHFCFSFCWRLVLFKYQFSHTAYSINISLSGNEEVHGPPGGEPSRGWVYFVHPLRMNRGFSWGEFSEAVQDSQRDYSEGTGCVGALLSDVLPWLLLLGAIITSLWSPLSRVSALYWYYTNYSFKVCVRSSSFYSIQLLSWLLLFGASIASLESPLSRVSVLYWYYKNYGCVYVIADIVYWSMTIMLFYYVLF